MKTNLFEITGAIYNKLVSDLANMQCPDYSHDFEEEVVYNVFQSVWKDFQVDQEWLSKLKSDLLDQETNLSDENCELFPFRVRGPGNYFRLSKNGESVGVFIGPYGKPVQFCQLKK